MGKSVEKIAEEIRELADVEKLRLVNAILTDLDKPDPEIDRGVGEGGAQTVGGLQSRQDPNRLL